VLLKPVKEAGEKLCYKLHMFYRRSKGRWCVNGKIPEGYASNLSRCVDMRNASLHNLKSLDCRVFIQCLLPMAFKNLLPTNVWKVLTELS